jgi:PKD repeat protein
MKLTWKFLCPLMLALGMGSLAAAPDSGHRVPHIKKRPFPQLSLPDRHAAGQRAIDNLGQRLPEIAEWYGKSPDEFKAQFLKDRRMRLDRRGRVFVVEEIDQPIQAPAAAAASTGMLDGTLAPLDQTFLLHSRPGAKRTIYLNFKGATLTGTVWNDGSGNITALPYDLDGLPYSFNTTELQRIQYIWQRVAEDYAVFDVDVTTEAVAPELLARGGTSDDIFGTTVLITKKSGVYSCSCGGVAYLGVFDETSNFYKPALVFYDALGGGSEKHVAEAISHEAGHNMGLAHDGTATLGYYTGHGTGATGWAPIMGVGYSKSLVQWSKGEYNGANNLKDDYAVMQSNGLPLRADDHGNMIATATVLAGVSSGGVSSATVQGVIGRPDDVDVFAFAAAAGPINVSLSPAARSANLDAQLTLHDGAGNVMVSANPADALNASLSAVLPAGGTYYLSVQGVGKGSPLSTGYSNYGSVGQYAIKASYPAPASQAPVAAISTSTLRGTAPLTVNFSAASSYDPDGSIVLRDWNFGDGLTASGATASHSYATPGTYSVQLKVTDNSGLSASTSVTIVVDPVVVVLGMRVADIGMSIETSWNGNARGVAAVKVLNPSGQPVSGAVVRGNWSGLVSQTGDSGTTNAAGIATISSANTRNRNGNFVFTVTDVTRSGYSYQPQTNTETTDSIAR